MTQKKSTSNQPQIFKQMLGHPDTSSLARYLFTSEPEPAKVLPSNINEKDSLMDQKTKNLVKRLKNRVAKKTVKSPGGSSIESLFSSKEFRSRIQQSFLLTNSHPPCENFKLPGKEHHELSALSGQEDEKARKEQLNKSDFFSYFDKYMHSQSDRVFIRSQMTFKCAKKNLIEFVGKEELLFESINLLFLSQLYKWFKTRKQLMRATIKTQLGIYHMIVKYAQHEFKLTNCDLSQLRCFKNFLQNKEQYRTPIIDTNTLLQLSLYEADTKTDAFGWSEKKVLDFIKMARLCSHSTVDRVLELTKKQVASPTFELTIRNTSKNSKMVVTVYRTPELERLINQHKQKGNTTYVFPFLNLTAAEKKQLKKSGVKNGIAYQQELHAMQRKKILQALIRMNRHLRKIAATLNLNVELNVHSLQLALRHLAIQQQQSGLRSSLVRRQRSEEFGFGA